MNAVSKYYKPELMDCPKCGKKLSYRYAVSQKLVYFTNGRRNRIHNLGYSCPNCKDNMIYVSQTANKLAFKGYTYSVKIVCMIAKLKEKKMNREEICDYFFSKNIEISDRNVDNLYEKYLECIRIDYKKRIPEAYKVMQDTYNQIRISIDLVTVCGTIFIIFYDYFSTEMLAFVRFEGLTDPKVKEFLEAYLNPKMNITVIASIRRDAIFIPMLKKLCPTKTKFIAFNKF